MVDLRKNGMTLYVAQNIQAQRRSAIDRGTARILGYAQSISARKGIEGCFGGSNRPLGTCGSRPEAEAKVAAVFRLYMVAYKLIRISNLLRAQSKLAVMA